MDTDFPDYIALTDSCPDYNIIAILDCNVLKIGTARTPVSAKVGPLKDISDVIEDGKEFAGDVTSGNINQMCVTKTYSCGKHGPDGGQKFILNL